MTTRPTPGADLQVPADAPSSGPVPLRITLVADMPTYYANGGAIAEALRVVVIRRDAPGVGFVATSDPRGHVTAPASMPLPPPDRMPTGVVREVVELDLLGHGARHDGDADYFVLAAFSEWSSAAQPLSIRGAGHPLPPGKARALPPAPQDLAQRPAGAGRLFAALTHEGGELRIDGWVAPPSEPHRAPRPTGPAFVTIVVVRLDPRGGAAAACFELGPEAGGDAVGFRVPLRDLLADPPPGRYRVFVFAGDDAWDAMDAALLAPP